MNAETKSTELDANPDIFVTDFSDLITCQQRVDAMAMPADTRTSSPYGLSCRPGRIQNYPRL